MKRYIRGFGIGLVAVTLAVTACAPAEETDPGAAVGEGDAGAESDVGESKGEREVGGSIIVALEAETPGWSPWGETQAQSGVLVSNAFFDTLLERDADGVPQPNLAESIEPNNEFTQYTLVLRDGIEFHDGEPLDAEAVVANIEQHREPGSVTGGAVAPIEDVTAEDELTVVFILDQPHVAFADVLVGSAGRMVSPAAFDTVSDEPVGAGPFVFESWQRDQELVVSRNENYWRDDKPYLEQITFRPIPDEDARLQSLFAGDVDVMQTLRQSIVAQARERADEFNHYEHIGNDAGGVILNTAVPPFDDVRVRQAWAHAINQDELIEVLGGTGITPPAHGLFSPDSPWYDPEMADVWPDEDVERARELLDEYVEDPERSDGQEPGAPVSVELDTPPDPSLLEISSVYQAQLARIDMKIDIRTVEQAVHVQQAVGEPPEFIGDYQAKLWRLGSEADPDWMMAGFADGSPTNFTSFHSEELMGLLLEARQSPEFEERKALYNQAMRLFAEEVPFTFSGFTATLLATDPALFGFDDWELPDGEPGVGHPESVARWHSVWLDGPE